MKLFLITASLLVSSMAFAMPTVGDYAQYDVTVTQEGSTQTGVLDQEITAFNQANNSYSVKSSMNSNNQVQSQVREVQASQLLSTDVVNQALSNCAQGGATLEVVTTPAGTFNTCAIAIPASNGVSGKINIGLVAFGLVRSELTGPNQSSVAVLKSQRLAQ